MLPDRPPRRPAAPPAWPIAGPIGWPVVWALIVLLAPSHVGAEEPGRSADRPPPVARTGGPPRFPLTVSPAGPDLVLPAVPNLPVPDVGSTATGRPAPGAVAAPALPAWPDAEIADEDAPARPGSFSPAPTRLPGQLLRGRTVGPRQPDLQMDVSRRTSVGVFGEMSRIEREDIRTQTLRPTRDLGAGVTLQYKFGDR